MKTENLPSNCAQWIKSTSSSSADFVALFSEDFRPKLAKELADIEQEQRDALKSLNEAQNEVKEVSEVILKNLNDILSYFKRKDKTVGLNDPWISELTVRHFSSKFLDNKSEYLVVLYRIYTQIRHLNTELSHKLVNLSDEFLRILERFGLAPIDEKSAQIDFSSLNLGSVSSTTANLKQTNTQWETILKSYSLDYEWKLACPPLDGFLSTLYNHLKSLGANLTIEICSGNLPKIFPESFLRFGFLQKSVSGLLTRTWNVYFAILQPSTGFLHLYKVNKTSGTNEGNLLVPSAGNSYTKSSLHDLNILATQFYLQSPHQPATISPQTLAPFLSIPIGPNCRVTASDPVTFTFVVRPSGGDKVTLKAFCEEEFVDWVIFLNETIKKTKPSSVLRSPVSSVNEEKTESPDSSPTLSAVSKTLSEPQTQTQMETQQPVASTSIFSSVTAIVDLENPWE